MCTRVDAALHGLDTSSQVGRPDDDTGVDKRTASFNGAKKKKTRQKCNGQRRFLTTDLFPLSLSLNLYRKQMQLSNFDGILGQLRN